MSATASLVTVAARVLEAVSRPLSVRKILDVGVRESLFVGDPPSVETLRGELEAVASDDGPIRQLRRGVFALDPVDDARRPPATPRVEAEESADDDVADGIEGTQRRRRRRRRRAVADDAAPTGVGTVDAAAADASTEDHPEVSHRRHRRTRAVELVEEEVAAPLTIDEAVADAEAAEKSGTRRDRLWNRIRSNAAALADAPPPVVSPSADAIPAAVAAPVAMVDDGVPTTPRARLKARLGARRGKAESAPAVEAPAAVEAIAAVELPVAVGGGTAVEVDDIPTDPRARLKSRLARRKPALPRAEVPPPSPETPDGRIPVDVEPPEERGGESEASPREIATRPVGDRARRGRSRRRKSTDASGVAEESQAEIVTEKPLPLPPAADAENPRARLRSRLAQRARTAGAVEAPAPEVVEEVAVVAVTETVDVQEPRSRLRARLARRAEMAGGAAANSAAPREAAEPQTVAQPAPTVIATPAPSSAVAVSRVSAPDLADAEALSQAVDPPVDPKARLRSRLASRPKKASPPAAVVPVAVEKLEEPVLPSVPSQGDTEIASPRSQTRGQRGRRVRSSVAQTPVVETNVADARVAPDIGVVPAAEPAAASVADAASPIDPRARLRSRLAERRRGTEPKPTAPKELATEPYQERREEPTAPPPVVERRQPVLPEVASRVELVSAALEALRARGEPMALDALISQISDKSQGSTAGLRAALRAENARCEAAGGRPPLAVGYDGAVRLTEWGISDRTRALEETIRAAIVEQAEIVRRELLAHVAGLSDAGFEQAMRMLLDGAGYESVRVVHRQPGGNLVLTGRSDVGGAPLTTAILMRRAWTPIGIETLRALRDNLHAFGASRGLVITVGTFDEAARSEAARLDQAAVHLVDGAGLARMLYERSLGTTTARPVISYVDLAFFEGLA